MTVKDLKNNYEVLKASGGIFHLHSLTETGRRSPIKYLCSVKKVSNTRFCVDGFESTSNFNALQEQIKNKIESYEYDSEYYNPCYREGVFEELIIHDYLCSLGFKIDGLETYVLADKNIYGFNTANIVISIWGLDAFNDVYNNGSPKRDVAVILHIDQGSWVKVNCNRNVEDIKLGIDNLLKPLLLTDSVNFIKKAEKLHSNGDIDIFMRKLSGNLDFIDTDVKSYLKGRLLEIASEL